jgi:hypothetical protein
MIKKNFLFISRDWKQKPEIESKILETVDNNNYCNYDLGFFLLSLKSIANLDFIFGFEELDIYLEKKFDAIFIDLKAFKYKDVQYLLSFRKKITTSICLFSAIDEQIYNNKFSGKKIVDLLEPQLIYSANLFKDYNRYKLSLNNLEKLRLTFYGMGSLNIQYDLKNHSFQEFKSLPKINDLFFSGRSSSPIRAAILDFINKNFSDLKKIIKVNSHLNRKEYINLILQSKINLALPGNCNNISYRVNEILFLQSFLLTDNSFKNYEMSKYFSELDSFVFNNSQELINLVYFYNHSEKDREKITSRLNQQFTDFYCPKKHGEKIYNDLFN